MSDDDAIALLRRWAELAPGTHTAEAIGVVLEALRCNPTDDDMARVIHENADLTEERDALRVALSLSEYDFVIPTLCVECGPAVHIDEDGCCAHCGNGATGSWLSSQAHPSTSKGAP